MLNQEPAITALGVYRFAADEESLREQLREYYAKNTSSAANANVVSYIDRVVPLVLIEAIVCGLDGKFDVGQFTQEMEAAPEEAWQVAYDEALLSSDGSTVVHRGIGCVREVREGRIAFYFHYYDESRSMRWTYGHFRCPPVGPLPRRLRKLLPYEPPG